MQNKVLFITEDTGIQVSFRGSKSMIEPRRIKAGFSVVSSIEVIKGHRILNSSLLQ